MSSGRHWILIGGLLGLLGACQGPERIPLSNPLDQPPDTIIEGGPVEGSTLTAPDVAFRWKGSNPLVSEFSYRLNEGAWSPWGTTRSVTFTLDDSAYTFSVRGRIPPDPPVAEVVDETPATVRFTVDAVRGPTIVVRPRYMELNADTPATVEVFANEVSDLFLAHIVLTYDPSKVRVQRVAQGSLFDAAGGQVVFLDSLNVRSGLVIVDTGLAAGAVAGVSATGSLVRLTIAGIAPGDTQITVDPRSRLRRTDNTDIPLNSAVDGHMVIR